MLFRLLAGQHAVKVDGVYRTYRVGDVVESEIDLVAKCGRDKFLLVVSPPSRVNPHTFPEPEKPEPVQEQPPEPVASVRIPPAPSRAD